MLIICGKAGIRWRFVTGGRMKRGRYVTGMVCVVISVVLLAGCGSRTPSGGATVHIPECGFSMNLPAGWATEQYSENDFYRVGDRDNCWGAAKFCPMSVAVQGQFRMRRFEDVSQFTRHLVEEDRFEGTLKRVISNEPRTIGQVAADAREIVCENDDGTYSFHLFIAMDNGEALQVFFTVPAGRYERFAAGYPAVVDSIRLTKTRPEY